MTETIECPYCRGCGRMQITQTQQDTLAGVRRMTNVGGFVVANMHADWFGCKPTALNNRLKRLEELGLITSTKHGRQRRYVAK